jgi:hypothetical protein
MIEMYLVTMDQRAQEDIVAAAAAHHELGRDYDSAVAEGLIERIGAEIDKRVDARIGTTDRGASRPVDVTEWDRRRRYWTGVGVGAAVASIPAILVAGNPADSPRDVLQGLIGVWFALAVIFLVATWARRTRGRE